MTRCCVRDDTSTTGASPVTVMVSSRDPTRISPSTEVMPLPDTMTPSRFAVLKPASVKVTAYAPGRNSVN